MQTMRSVRWHRGESAPSLCFEHRGAGELCSSRWRCSVVDVFAEAADAGDLAAVVALLYRGAKVDQARTAIAGRACVVRRILPGAVLSICATLVRSSGLMNRSKPVAEHLPCIALADAQLVAVVIFGYANRSSTTVIDRRNLDHLYRCFQRLA